MEHRTPPHYGPGNDPYTLTANRIAKYLHVMGLEFIKVHGSSISRSIYIDADFPDPLIRHIKIRVSDHEPRPTYERLNGAADFEVSVGAGHQATDGTWIEALRHIASMLGQPVPAEAERYAASVAKAQETRKQKQKQDAQRKERESAWEAQRPEREAQAALAKAQRQKLTKHLLADEVSWNLALQITRTGDLARSGTKKRQTQDQHNADLKSQITHRMNVPPQEVEHADWEWAISNARNAKKSRGL